MKVRTFLLATSTSVCCAQPVFAQSQAPAPTGSNSSQSAAPSSATSPSRLNNAAAAAGQGDAGLGEIIITAQKGSESLQKAPAAITVIGGPSLVARGITDISTARVLIPS